MKKIIPFKKDIIFKTNVSEITSISLEHEFEHNLENVHGNFNLSGQYKVTDTSTNVEDFSYEIPFDIRIDEKYDVSNMKVDIDDFYYEIVNNQVLSVSIDVAIDNLEEKNIIELEEYVRNVEHLDILEQPKEEIKERCIEEEDVEKKDKVLSSIFDNLDDGLETYQSYHIYIVREGDTLDYILDKYDITKEEIESYNDISELRIGDKIIIPKNYEES